MARQNPPQEQEPITHPQHPQSQQDRTAGTSGNENTDNPLNNVSSEASFSVEELLYSSSSFHAIVKPVAITMILAALCVTYVNTAASIQQGEEALSRAYEAFDNTNRSSTASTLGVSLINAIIICCVIGAMTFGIVLLYKYKCYKCLTGYMMFSSALLLGFLGAIIFQVGIERYRLNIDQFSFYFTMWNFAIVGVTAIYWGQGIPSYVTQGYLICTSVILAWQLSHFSDWTAWTLLVVLALYDLCAVLTPCGPLKALVNVMQQDDAAPLPGLLYEAELPSAARRPGRRRQQQQTSASSSTGNEPPSATSTEEAVTDSLMNIMETQGGSTETAGLGVATNSVSAPRGRLPLAIAKLYRLPYNVPEETAAPASTTTRRPSFTPLLDSDGSPRQDQQQQSDTSTSNAETPEQLHEMMDCEFPRGGGRIDRVRRNNGDVRYIVKDRHGVVKRILFLNTEGRVFEERSRNDDDEGDNDNTIKLGLGDFIFYSVLVSKAVQYSFTTFAACTLVVLSGLGLTLILLAVYQQALPALPISIFLGVTFFLLTRLLIEPWIHDVLQNPSYV